MRVEQAARTYWPRNVGHRSLLGIIAWISGLMTGVFAGDLAASASDLKKVGQQLVESCLDCHGGDDPAGDLELGSLLQPLSLGQSPASELETWVRVFDRIQAGEMPPDGGLPKELRQSLLPPLETKLIELDRQQVAAEGRAVWRRMNRWEYENSLRDLLQAPWLQLATILPEDGEVHRFNKPGEALDVSHVNLQRYLQAANYALREVLARDQDPPPKTIVRYYAREQSSFSRRVHYNPFNRSPERATFPLIDYQADVAVLRDSKHPFTVGDADSDLREREAFGVVASSYEPIEIRFSEFKAPVAGRYLLRFKGYTFWAVGEDKRWWRPDREKVSRGRRSEPVTIYSMLPPRQLRQLGSFDFQIEPGVQELEVWLLAGETIQPDAVRLFRSRPPNWHNPLAEKDGMPGVAFNWMEVEGPMTTEWPPVGHRLLFDDLPLQVPQAGAAAQSIVATDTPMKDARRLLRQFLNAAYEQPANEDDVERFAEVVRLALREDLPFSDAMLTAYSAILCSPRYLCLQEQPGPLSELAIAHRLSFFLANSAPDDQLVQIANEGQLSRPEVLREQVERLLESPRSRRFVDAFLDYWLDLRKINDTSPDEQLYPDYYLDDALVSAALRETQLFFSELIAQDLPVANLIDSDFTFVNERLAKHYDLPSFEGAHLRRVALPDDSVRGGVLTQASVLKVTANGTTTSPVVRGAWVNERLLGISTPPPPASVPAIEPDTRGATTIREQLARHRADDSCNACHRIIDPAGFALESFDVVGGYRTAYRSLQDGEPVPGFGKNGQPFRFSLGPVVEPSGELPDGESFADVRELKRLLLAREREIAQNLVDQLVTYATGAPPRFSDRREVQQILDRQQSQGFPVRSLIHEIVSSRMFLNK